MLQLLYDVTLSCTDKGCGLNYPENHINLIQCTLGNLEHVLSKLVLCPVDTRCIKEYDLSLIAGVYCLYPVSCGLCLIAGYRYLLTYQSVHKCRLSNIRSAYNRHKTRLVFLIHISPLSRGHDHRSCLRIQPKIHFGFSRKFLSRLSSLILRRLRALP